MDASRLGYIVTIRALLEAGADVSLTNNDVSRIRRRAGGCVCFSLLTFPAGSWCSQGKNAVDLACSEIDDQSSRAEIQKLIREWPAGRG